MTTTRILYLILLAVCTVSCEYNVEEEDMEEISCDPGISFSTTVRPIIDNNCIQCHNGSVHPLDFRNFSTVKDNAEKIRELTEAGIMPKQGSLTSEEIALIGCWVDNGAADN
ncbi:hypothetical protein [Sinomicrobium weinanense]|uniref:Cytochrome c domain-containing protein n=1 Tax=Sinomicrobium weinanense TaxID=2842200 RepID=A0A926JVI7_9FLAO|nr:hypothetical protein [Sinomicrobium weinanense]MBC9797973.1 hypothetical protein [Sinomicrobium weinanense]MBU3125510.1 hypothetical protein [Sinomicrobium weinanense]